MPRTAILEWFKVNTDKSMNEFVEYLNLYQKSLTDIENIVATKLNLNLYNKYFDPITYPTLTYKVDFKLTDKIAVNVDGLYWHSYPNISDKKYHFNLRKLFESSGLRIFQFRADEIYNKLPIINSILLNATNKIVNKVYGRQTKIKNVSQADASRFLKENHMMEDIRAKHIGLYIGSELISILSYKIYKDRCRVERFCSKVDHSVVGGFSKLIKHLESILGKDIKFIDYWVDLRYGTGNHLVNFGFKMSHETLGWQWTDRVKTYNRLQCRANLDERGLSESEYASELGWSKIYDAGQRLYIKGLK